MAVEISRVELVGGGAGIFDFDAHAGELFEDIYSMRKSVAAE